MTLLERMNKKGIIALSVVIVVLLIDQIIKVWVKTNMYLGEEFSVFGDWFKIHFVENNGMAFGMEMGGSFGKILLSVFRIIAVCGIIYYIVKLCKTQRSTSFIVCLSLVLSGAIGNIVDSVFYGVIFDSSIGQVATLFPEDGGYSTWLHGRVVDMFYFPLVSGHFPEWFPVWGGESYLFFRPVFNFADSAITVGIALLLLFQRNELSKDFNSSDSDEK